MTRKFIIVAWMAASLWGAAAMAQTAATDYHSPTFGSDTPPAPPPVPVVAAPPAKPEPVTVEIPVLLGPKNTNEVIKAEDLTLQAFPEKRIHGDVLRDSTQIVGQAARRQLQAGQPLRLLDLQKEQLVKRGDDVTLVFRNGSLDITASAKAQESGALGDSIRVLNLGSNHAVDAKVTGPKQVEVTE